METSRIPTSNAAVQGRHLRGKPCRRPAQQQAKLSLLGYVASRSRPCSVSLHRQQSKMVSHAVVGFHESSRLLRDIEVQPIINIQGLISPDVPEGTQATVFAIYDGRQKLQYIGFSKDIRNSLRTVFSRRPSKAHFYRTIHLPQVDQQEMIGIRDAWFEESGGAPPGNQLALERTAWQQPVDAGAISQRGKKGAAEEMAVQLLRAMKERGCKEEFVPNPNLVLEGMVDFLPAAALNEAEVSARRAAIEALAKLTHPGHVVVDGQSKTFSLFFKHKYPTNNGFMMDVVVTYDNQETEHRIIIGKEYYEAQGIEAEKVLEATLALLIEQKVPRQTEGMLQSSQFPSNYFSVSHVDQWFGDDFSAMYERCTGIELPVEKNYWRFNRVEEYGAGNKPPGSWKQTSVGKYS